MATLMFTVGIAVFGWLSYGQLEQALMPELSYPTLTVRTAYSGAAPQEIEEEVTRPFEELLRTVENVRAVESVTRAGVSDIVIEFQWDTNMDYATQRVHERIDVLRLPDGADKPIVLRYDPSLDPVLRLGLSRSDTTQDALEREARLTELRRLADDMRDELVKVEGVALVRVHGGREAVVLVELDQQRLAQFGISAAEIEQRLGSENVNIAGGELEDGGVRYLVRTLNEFADVDDLRDMAVGTRNGQQVRLFQVARIGSSYADPEVITRINGSESVELEVFKEADANLVQVVDRIRDKVFGTEEQRAYVEKAAAGELPPETKADAVEGESEKDEKKRKRARAAREERRRSMTNFMANKLPEPTQVTVLSDPSRYVVQAIDEVTTTALLGGLFAILVLYLFLRSPRSTVIIGLAIPLSVICTFAPMRMLGVNLNIMSLGGLALGIGMLVDNSIVVLESIVRCSEEGDDPRAAAIRGVKEVGGAVVASTLTTIAVFFPIAFVDGVAGQLFGDLALTVVFSLLASLAVALFVVPTLAARDWSKALETRAPRSGQTWYSFHSLQSGRDDLKALVHGWRESGGLGKALSPLWRVVVAVYIVVRTIVFFALELAAGKLLFGTLMLGSLLARGIAYGLFVAATWIMKPAAWGVEKLFAGVLLGYRPMLSGALRNRLLVVVLAGGAFGGALWLGGDLGAELIPVLHQGRFQAEVRLPVGTSLQDTAAEVAHIEKALGAVEAVEAHSSFIGVEASAASDSDRGEHSATVHVELNPARDLEAHEAAAMDEVRTVLRGRAGVQYELLRPTLFTLQTPIEVEVRGNDLRQLRRSAEQVEQRLRGLPGLTDVRNNLRSGHPEVQVRFDRDQLQARGISVRQAADAVRRKVRGVTPTELRRDGDRIDVLVRANRDDVATVADLEDLIVGQSAVAPTNPTDLAALTAGSPGQPVTLGSVADIRVEEGPSEIRRLDGHRAAVIAADVSGLDLESAAARMQVALSDIRLPRGMSLAIGGQNAEISAARSSMLFALLLAIFLVYLVMASQFESVVAPLVILASVPLAVVGVAVGLWLTDTTLSVVVFIGLIMLAGIVVNNAIVLVDYALKLRERGMPTRAAIQKACEIRLRPVLISTLTTILGLLPMVLGLGEGAEVRRPMALTVIAGLGASTVLTLIVVPVLLDLVTRRRNRADAQSSTSSAV